MRLLSIYFLSFLFATLVIAVPGCKTDMSQSVHAVAEDDRITVFVNGEEFTSYLFGHEHKYPFFYPVAGPLSGRSVTTWDQEPYPHHSSLYVSLDMVRSENVERGNYWQPRHELETGQVFSRNAVIVEDDGKKVVLSDDTEWIVPATGTRHFNETRTVTIRAPSTTVRIMDFEFEFDVQTDLSISPTGHSFFSARMRPELAVGCMDHGPDWAHLGTGTIVDSEGNRDEEGTREKLTDWAAYYGNNDGVTEGLAIIQHPGNSYYPGQWVTRDYGFFSPSSFCFNEEPVEMKAGQVLSFRYRVVVFAGDHEEAGIAGWHSDFVNQ
ncbi:MAG: DUF6807 family protein [Bacteroidales bacterium]